MTKLATNIFITVLFLFVCHESIDVWMFNTGDFDRAITPFMQGIAQFSTDDVLIYPMRDSFNHILSYDYKSSFSFILYGYAYIISFFTHSFDLRIWASLSKLIYILFLYMLFKEIIKKRIFILFFPFLIIPLITPSILSQFTAFYQEQIVITLIPLILVMLIKEKRSNFDFIIMVSATAIIATAKSQFFYVPILVSFCEFIFKKNSNIKLHLSLLLSLLIAISFSVFSPSATKVNSYHSLYFGTLLYNKINHKQNPSWADEKCIGIDAWGNEFDLDKGAISTQIGESCYNSTADHGLKDSLILILKNPVILLKLPFDTGIKSQLSEDYFHVFKSIKLINSKGGWLIKVQEVKDMLLKDLRIPLSFFLMIVSLVLYKKRYATSLFFLSSLSLSQFYISFLGEGYRDLNKHLFTMNYSFDLIIFISLCMVIKFLFGHVRR
ncbi:hypothetical protein [Pantoea sp. 1.19]|uniref:hypothetical protein n=1 Tax=Pantoea sp. 1.19 TaxID=1925589 RepID=UPI00094902AE|nr:hypothetical protein [Pantoea sp. 1.19]